MERVKGTVRRLTAEVAEPHVEQPAVEVSLETIESLDGVRKLIVARQLFSDLQGLQLDDLGPQHTMRG